MKIDAKICLFLLKVSLYSEGILGTAKVTTKLFG